MVNFLKLQYQLGRISDEQLDRLVEMGRITEQELLEIKGN